MNDCILAQDNLTPSLSLALLCHSSVDSTGSTCVSLYRPVDTSEAGPKPAAQDDTEPESAVAGRGQTRAQRYTGLIPEAG
jgi:hypothetical protein